MENGRTKGERLNHDHWKQIPRTWSAWPWQYFKPEEMACRGTGKLEIECRLLDYLDGLRRIFAHPLVVLSAYRTPYHNSCVGGAPMSRHLSGDAVDIAVVGLDKTLIERLAREKGFAGFGYYRTFLHLDLGRPRWWGKKWDV
jgi:zinc D-Ala-D-Ala carboxypeptidase